jgi:co-chaperonin GroES (HSP10)
MPDKFQPGVNKILLERYNYEQTTASGLKIVSVVPQAHDATQRQKTFFGKVREVGIGKLLEDGKTRAEPPAKVGDIVAHSSFAGNFVDFDAQQMVILDFGDVLGVVKIGGKK